MLLHEFTCGLRRAVAISSRYHASAPTTLFQTHHKSPQSFCRMLTTVHRGENGEALPVPTTAAPKLGPKANAGAINACLRALDRTGTPCRKWTKRSFAVRSFTGYSWGAGAYAARRKIGADGSFPGDVTSDTSSTGDKTQEVLGSGVQSEKSSQEVDTPMGGSAAVGTPVAAAS